MDFIIGLSRIVRQHDYIMVVVERLPNVAHFLPVKSIYSTNDVAQIFIKDIVRSHGVPKKIILYRDAKFTSRF